jgi:hypothetical protein
MSISKKDAFKMTPEQVAAGQKAWAQSGQQGRLVQSTFSAEDSAPRTWIFWVNAPSPSFDTLECEIYLVSRASDPTEGIAMLVGMCPKCGEHFSVREDNKQMHIEWVPYRKAARFIRMNYARHLMASEGRRPRDEDKIPVVSSPERWACDYCHEWCVKVQGGVARDDYSGANRIVIDKPVHIFGENKPPKGDVDF